MIHHYYKKMFLRYFVQYITNKYIIWSFKKWVYTCESDVQINNEDVANIFASLSSTLSKNLTQTFE